MIALIGDVGGTNVRLTLRKLNLDTRHSVEVKPLTLISSQKVESFQAAVKEFLSEFDPASSEQWPKVGVVGIAGEVKANIVCTTNIPHWPPTDGRVIAQTFNFDHFELVNDFSAAAHGLCQL